MDADPSAIVRGAGRGWDTVRIGETPNVPRSSARRSVRERAVDGVEDAVEVGEVVLLDLGRRIRRVEPSDAQDRRLQGVERALRDLRGDLGAEAAVHRRLVHDHATAGAADGVDDG